MSRFLTQAEAVSAMIALRKRLGLTQPEFALKHGLNLRSLQNWESGHRLPQFDGYAQIMSVLEAHKTCLIHKKQAIRSK